MSHFKSIFTIPHYFQELSHFDDDFEFFEDGWADTAMKIGTLLSLFLYSYKYFHPDPLKHAYNRVEPSINDGMIE
jgi:hypothetical protein